MRLTILFPLLTFYRTYAVASWLISLLCLIPVYDHGTGPLITLFWLKIISYSFIVYFINSFKKKEFYYYKNLGLSKQSLWAASLSADVLLVVLCIILILLVR